MSIAILTSLRDAIAADPAITTFFNDRYSKPLTHLIGYEKIGENAEELPKICYVQMPRKFTKLQTQALDKSAIFLHIIENETTGGIRDGALIIDQATELLIDFFRKQPLPKTFFHNISVANDLGVQHPFYEMGISFDYHYDRRT